MNPKAFRHQYEQFFLIPPIDPHFQSRIKEYLPRHSPQFSPISFPQSIYLPFSEEEPNPADIISYKFDSAYYHALKEIDWNVFLTLKFRQWRFKSLSKSAFKERRRFLWDLGHEVISELNLSLNDLQYFWAEETNSTKEAHMHVLFHRVYPEKCSVEELRKSIERNLDPNIVQIPQTLRGQEPPHVQTVRSVTNAARYLLKVPLFQEEPKVLGHSFKFVRFWNRHIRWRDKQAA